MEMRCFGLYKETDFVYFDTRVNGLNVVWYSRCVGVRSWRDGARGRCLQYFGGAHHHVKLTWV